MTSLPQCSATVVVNQGFNSNQVVDSNAGALMGVHESYYRFFPATTERTEGATDIEKLNAKIARLCLSSSCSFAPSSSPCFHDNRVTNGISDKRQKILKNIYDNGGSILLSKGPDSVSAMGSTAQQLEHQESIQNVEAKESVRLLFLVRHGQTDMNAAGRLQGRGVDAPLNANGRKQADELGHFLRNVPFGAVMASSLKRAHQTAIRIVAQNLKISEDTKARRPMAVVPTGAMRAGEVGGSVPDAASQLSKDAIPSQMGLVVPQDKRLDELSWGVMEGEDAAQEPWKGQLAALKAGWDDGHFEWSAERGESVLDVEARSLEALDALLDRGHELNLVVSHGRTLRILLLSLTGLGLDKMTAMGKILNTGLYILEVRQTEPHGTRTYRLLSPECFEKDVIPLSESLQNETVPQHVPMA